MCPQQTALQAVIWTMYFISILPQQAQTTGVFELQILSFQNSQGVTLNGSCCNGYKQQGVCSAPCKTFFKVCLSHYQADIATNLQPKCTFAKFTTTVVGNNTVNFPMLAELPSQGPSRPNTFSFPVKDFSWPGDFSLIIEAWTRLDTPSQDSQNVLIARLAEIKSAESRKTWYKFEHTFNNTVLNYAFRFTCDNHYYGANCAELCRPRDDGFGHYSCSSNGTKVCLDGWDGQYCDVAVCLPGCDPSNGFCDQPNECKCRLGWQGKFCTECIPHPSCKQGKCEKPWQCNCDEGWGGLYCNQDLNFCTHHNPCMNGAVCTNTGQGGYTCTCVGSYTGVNCEREVDDCKNKPCINNGVCKDIGNGFQCQCPQGFYGRQCEKEAMSCKANPCMYGSTCIENEDTYYCLCQAGYTGFNCDMEINECESSPCLNGGQCIDQLNGYSCVCPAGYSGQKCQNNDDDCQGKPCLNNGVCVDLINDFRCQCVPGFVGTLCQENVDDCGMRPCANGGRCYDLVNDFRCDCAPGFEGKDCSFQINECKSNPCLNGGICRNLFADYSCSCSDGFWGKNCHLSESATAAGRGDIVNSGRITTERHGTTVANGDTAGQIGSNIDDDDDDDDDDMSKTHILIGVCLGCGITLIIIIVIVIVILCRKRSFHQRDTQQNMENLAREKEQRYINNINKSGEIFTTLPTSASNSSSIKISNEEQQDINKLKAKHLMLGSFSDLDGGGNLDSPSSAKLPASSSKQFLHNVVAQTHHELPSTSSSSSLIPSSTSTAPCSSTIYKGGSRASGCDFENEKPYRKLDVDSLQADTRRLLSEHKTQHSQDTQPVVKPQTSELIISDERAEQHRSRDTAHSPTSYACSSYRAASPTTAALSLIPQHQQQQQQQQQQQPQILQKPFHKYSHYGEDYLATEV